MGELVCIKGTCVREVLKFLALTCMLLMVNGARAHVEGQPVQVARVVWEYRETPDFYSFWGGDADRLPNGNTLITDCANGRIVEVTPTCEKVWECFLPHAISRCERIANLNLTGTKLYKPEGYNVDYFNVTVWRRDKACNGITFVAVMGCLWGLNMTGQAVWGYKGQWHEQKMLPNGHLFLLFTYSKKYYRRVGWVREIDLDGNTISNIHLQNIHHDAVKPTEDTVMYLSKKIRYELDITHSKVSCHIWDEIRHISLSSQSTIWRWNLAKHLPRNHYCPICSRGPVHDWTHSNSLTYQREGNQAFVYLDVRNLNQIVKIDYQTKKIIWKLGENGDFRMFEMNGTEVTKLFSHQHDPEIQPNGNILLFDNGLHRNEKKPYSRVIEIEITSQEFHVHARAPWFRIPMEA